VGKGDFKWQDMNVTPSRGASYYVPILQVTLAGGAVFGNTNMETGNVDGRQWEVTASAPVRERFRPRSARRINGFSVQTAASAPGRLNWELRQGDSVLASGSLSAKRASYRTSAGLGHATGVLDWHDVAFNNEIAMQEGVDYDLLFTAEGSSVWRFADQRNGRAYGYAWPAAFTESQAETFFAGRWIGANHWNKATPGTGSNWRVVLHGAG